MRDGAYEDAVEEKLVPTVSQTVGPFFSIGLCPRNPNNLVPAERSAEAEVVTIRGKVLDGDGAGVPDAILEIWRADENGRFTAGEQIGTHDDSGVPSGFARIPTDDVGEFDFQTIRPAVVNGRDGTQSAPHLVVLVFMRGLLRHLLTRIYFPNELANERDPVLQLAPAERRRTLIAEPVGENEHELNWNIHLQGDAETVFFEA